MACAQGIRHIPADSHQNNLWGEMRSFETDRHVSLPHVVPLVMEGEHTANGLKGKLVTKPKVKPISPTRHPCTWTHAQPATRLSRGDWLSMAGMPCLAFHCIQIGLDVYPTAIL